MSRRKPRLVLDTNVVVSAVLWGGNPAQLLTLAGEGEIRLFTSGELIEELRATLERPKFANAVAATGSTVSQIMSDYRRLSTSARAAPIEKSYSRDPDDDRVIACALAARADCVVTGDNDLLELGTVDGIRICKASALLTQLV